MLSSLKKRADAVFPEGRLFFKPLVNTPGAIIDTPICGPDVPSGVFNPPVIAAFAAVPRYMLSFFPFAVLPVICGEPDNWIVFLKTTRIPPPAPDAVLPVIFPPDILKPFPDTHIPPPYVALFPLIVPPDILNVPLCTQTPPPYVVDSFPLIVPPYMLNVPSSIMTPEPVWLGACVIVPAVPQS